LVFTGTYDKPERQWWGKEEKAIRVKTRNKRDFSLKGGSRKMKRKKKGSSVIYLFASGERGKKRREGKGHAFHDGHRGKGKFSRRAYLIN